jgi:hypothetical protein
MVRVEWEDSAILQRGWQGHEDAETVKPVRGITVGFLLRDDEEAVTVAGSYGIEDEADDTNTLGGMCIPRSAVRKVERVRVAGARVKQG